MKNTPVTLAHLRLANQLVSSLPSPLVLATLIAESEAKSCGELSCDECNARTAALTAERDQLRAQVELWELAFQEQFARAERAEAEVKKLTGFYNEIVVECGHDRIVREYRQRGELLRDEANRRKEAEAELANIRALANRRNKRDHAQDTTHQLVAALDQALDIAQAELAATKSTLDEEVNCAEKAEHEVVRQYARAERAEADADSTRERALTLANSLDEAQAELAAEREKVRVLREACSHLSYLPRIQRALHKTEEPPPRV